MAKKQPWITDAYTDHLKTSFKVKKLVARKKTKHQNVAIYDLELYGRAVIMDGVTQSCTTDEYIYHDCLIHPALLLCRSNRPLDVLVLGTGEGATMREILKHKNVASITAVDIDKEAVELFMKHLPSMHQKSYWDPKVKLVFDSAEQFLSNTDQKFDVIYSDITDYTFYELGAGRKRSQLNFYRLIAAHLSESGILAMHTTSLNELVNSEHFMLKRFLQKIFPAVYSYRAFIPFFVDCWGFLVASKQHSFDPRSIRQETVGRIMKKKNLKLRYLNPEMFKAIFTLPNVLKSPLKN